MASKWPADNAASLNKFYGTPGTTAIATSLVKVIPPFRMTYAGKKLTHLMFHKKAAPALQRALTTVWDYYGHDQARIDKLGISKTAGTYNPRKIAGSNKWSNHAYGAAIDINAEQNGFNMAGNIPIPMISAFKAEEARWGGDYKGRKDPMHFEFCASGEPKRTFEQWLAHYGFPVKPVAPGTPQKPGSIDRKKLFDGVRKSLFAGKFTQGQVDGIDAIIDEWERRGLEDVRWLAYILATVYHETGKTMQPIREHGRGKGKSYGKLIDGKSYYGRGLVQLTWLDNYKKMGDLLGVDLVNNPDLALDPAIAAKILFEGMIRGSFTGVGLAKYLGGSKTDWLNARRIVNGTDRAALIAGYAQKFHDALT